MHCFIVLDTFSEQLKQDDHFFYQFYDTTNSLFARLFFCLQGLDIHVDGKCKNTVIAVKTMDNDVIFDLQWIFKSFADEICFKCIIAAVLLLGLLSKKSSGLPLQPSHEHLQA